MRTRIAVGLVALCVAPAMALDLPTRKPGLWELKTHVEGKTAGAQVVKQCIDAATDAQLQSFGSSMSAKMCSKQEVRREGDTVVSDTVCRFGPITLRSHSVMAGDFNSAYQTKTTNKQEGGPAIPGLGDSVTVVEARWVGPCEGDQRPGDVILSNGMKMNIGDMKHLMSGDKAPR